jgi:2,4-diaminopentanoate dehydrogenase
VHSTRHRVVQWATGNIGTYALRAVVEHPQLDLAGVYVHSAGKVGRDAGELCGLGKVGVLATGDIDEVVALGADCVLYMPAACDFDEVCRLLAGGANVVTTRGEFHRPESLVPAVRDRVEAACVSGGTSIHSTGSSPGFITEALPLVLTSIQRRLDALTIDEFADLSSRDSPELLFGLMGFGQPPAAYSEARVAHLRGAFGPSLQVLADALGLPLDSVEAGGEVATARHAARIAAGTVEAGTVGAQRVTVSAMHEGRAVLRFRANWYCTTDLEPAWDLRSTGWRVAVEGDAPLDVEITFPVPLERMAATTPAYTANRAVNAVPVVCAAAPGIRTTPELPHVVAALG